MPHVQKFYTPVALLWGIDRGASPCPLELRHRGATLPRKNRPLVEQRGSVEWRHFWVDAGQILVPAGGGSTSSSTTPAPGGFSPSQMQKTLTRTSILPLRRSASSHPSDSCKSLLSTTRRPTTTISVYIINTDCIEAERDAQAPVGRLECRF